MDREIAGLYQSPLSEFTARRNALAKTAGKDAARVKALEKPSVPAWAVNQLYWRDKRTYDRLIRASERLRAAHAQMVKGKGVELKTFEIQHMAAVRDAADAITAILTRSGDPATPATQKAVLDTLQALPGPGAPGQLTKALAPMGFGALGALMKSAVSTKALADVVTFVPPKPKQDEVAAAKARVRIVKEARAKELDKIFSAAMKALVGARARVDKAAAVKAAADAAQQKAAAALDAHRAEVARLEKEARTADQERAEIRASL